MPRILLCSAGHSSMVVPEAFCYLKGGFDEVHVFTTDSTKFDKQLLELYFSRLPNVQFTITKSEGISDILTETDFSVYQEMLWRWYLRHCDGEYLPYVCLSGGIKSMSACLQKAASLFGAQSIFHILADNNPNNLVDMENAFEKGEIHFIEMGFEPGWEALRHLKDSLVLNPVEQVATFETPVLTNLINEILGDVNRRAAGFGEAYHVPFPTLALLPPAVRQWLNMPLTPNDLEWIRSLPKIDLHCHLGGFATSGNLLNEVRKAADSPEKLNFKINPPVPDGWPLSKKPITLEKYMRLGDANGSTLLKDRGCLIRQVELLYQALCDDHVAYAEIRCSPNNYTDPTNGRSAWNVLQDIRETFSKLFNDSKSRSIFSCQVNLLVIASRKTSGDLSDISRHLSLATTAMQQSDYRCKVVGVDLAGFENQDTRASYFEHDFRAAHRCGLAVTAHAGENDDPEGIWQAVYTLHARRLGHALNLAAAPDLMRTVIERKIGVEMCPFANYQVKGFMPMLGQKAVYPLKKYLDSGVVVSVNTDNIGISGANLSENMAFLPGLTPGITRMDLLALLRNSIETAFISHEFRNELFNYFDAESYKICLEKPIK